MGMLDFLEVEEFVGRHWHRWASSTSSYPDHPKAAVRLNDLRTMLGVFFRSGGGEAGVEVSAIARRNSSHRLPLRQRLGLDEEPLDQARRDEEHLLLPPRIALFAEAELNRELYLWLTAYLARGGSEGPRSELRCGPTSYCGIWLEKNNAPDGPL